jgi:hypothetical protein
MKGLPIALLRIRMAPRKDIDLSPYEMLYCLPYLSSVTDVPTFETKTISSKIIYLDCPLFYFLLGKRGVSKAPPLDFPIHPHQLGDYVLIKT